MAKITASKVERYSVELPNEPGKAVEVLDAIAAGKADLLAAWGYPVGDGAKLELIPADGVAMKAAAKKAKIKVKKESMAFLIEGRSKVGALAEAMKLLSDAGVNVEAAQAIKVGAKYGALVEVASKNVRKAAKCLGAG